MTFYITYSTFLFRLYKTVYIIFYYTQLVGLLHHAGAPLDPIIVARARKSVREAAAAAYAAAEQEELQLHNEDS